MTAIAAKYISLEDALRQACAKLFQELQSDFPQASIRVLTYANEAFDFRFGSSMQRIGRPGGDEDAVVSVDVMSAGQSLTFGADLAGQDGDIWEQGPTLTVPAIESLAAIERWTPLVVSFVENLASAVREHWRDS
jgi:hypothetical protein